MPSTAPRLGRVGIWCNAFDGVPAAELRDAAGEVDKLGYGALWTGESFGREILTGSQLLLAATSEIAVAAGIASIWARDAMAAVAGQHTLGEAYGGRFLLGVGVSHAPHVGMRQHTYTTPLAAMAAYLDAMDTAGTTFRGVRADPPPARVVAALGPKMLELAGAKADGVHTYFVPVEHTVRARAALPPGHLVLPEQAVVLDTDPATARATARRHTSFYLRLPNYATNLRRLGFGDDDFAGGGSDRLVDAVVAWGSEDAIAARVREHLDAGADHVAVQVITDDRARLPRSQWKALAPALLAV
ncbi:MAG: class F420-dependent oxidoreductase [Frankiales bacterium]|nr:class F420-dependent oxidoreductase [Frankiales bacterium]